MDNVNKLKSNNDTILIGTELGYVYHLKNQNDLIKMKTKIHGCINDIDINTNIFLQKSEWKCINNCSQTIRHIDYIRLQPSHI